MVLFFLVLQGWSTFYHFVFQAFKLIHPISHKKTLSMYITELSKTLPPFIKQGSLLFYEEYLEVKRAFLPLKLL